MICRYIITFCFSLWGLTVLAQKTIDSLIIEQIEIAKEKTPHEAINLLKSIRQKDEFANAKCENRANVFHKIGVGYYNLDQEESALTYWRDTTLPLRQKCFGRYHKETARSYFNIGLANRYLGNIEAVVKNFSEALEIFEALPEKDTGDLAYKFMDVGFLYTRLKDFSRARVYLNQSESYFKHIGWTNTKEYAELMISLGELYLQENDFENAKIYFNRAINLYSSIDKKSFAKQIAIINQSLGATNYYLNDFQKAENYAKEAFNFFRELKYKEWQAKSLELLANIEKKKGEYEKALKLNNTSLSIRQTFYTSSFYPEIANSHENIADVYLLQEKINKALKSYQSALEIIVPGFSSTSDIQNPVLDQFPISNRINLQRILTLKAQALEKRFQKENQQADLKAAFETYQVFDTVITQIRQGFKAAGSKYFLMKQVIPQYENAIEIGLKLYEVTQDKTYLFDAYLLCSKNKALILQEGIQEEEAKSFANIPETLIEEERHLKKAYYELEAQILDLMQGQKDSLANMLSDSLFYLRRDYEKFKAQLEKDYPAYHQLKYKYPNRYSVQALQSLLPDNSLLIEYFVGKQHLYIFTLDQDNLSYRKLLKPDHFTSLCQQYRQLLEQLSEKDRKAFLTISYQLYQLLIAPVIEGNNSLERLFIVPDDILLQISFKALLTKDIKDWDSQLPYLLKKYPISLAYSSQLLFDTEKQKQLEKAKRQFGGFGLEYDDYTLKTIKDLDIDQVDSLLKIRAMGPLLYSDDEILAIAELVNGDSWINKEATKEAFLKYGADYNILHLAMHSVIDEEHPLNSALIFHRSNDSTNNFLRAADLYSLPLKAEMVVLSACNTGFGAISKGEGIRSLARAFSYSGSSSLIASLWEASDKTTKDILVYFYQNLKKGQDKDIALRNAQLRYLEEATPTQALPTYWAHLELIGDPEPLDFNSNYAKFWWLLGGLSILILGVFYNGRRKN